MNETEILAAMPDHLAKCGVPVDIREKLLGPQRETPGLTACREFWAGSDVVLGLVGGKGCGKSHGASWCITQNVLRYRPYLHTPGDLPPDMRLASAMFISARTDLSDRSLWDDADRSWRRQANKCQLLVIDEMGLERGDAESALFSVLADRIAAKLRTVFTSNLSPENFGKRYGDRLMSRIEGAGRIVNVHGPDMRIALRRSA